MRQQRMSLQNRAVNITYDDKNGNVNAIFTNITEEGMVYVAEYNENGTLLSIKIR